MHMVILCLCGSTFHISPAMTCMHDAVEWPSWAVKAAVAVHLFARWIHIDTRASQDHIYILIHVHYMISYILIQCPCCVMVQLELFHIKWGRTVCVWPLHLGAYIYHSCCTAFQTALWQQLSWLARRLGMRSLLLTPISYNICFVFFLGSCLSNYIRTAVPTGGVWGWRILHHV